MIAPTNADVARAFEQYATLLELSGESPFRARAYTRVAEALRSWPEPVGVLAAEGRLREVPGVGAGIAEAIAGIVDTGRFDLLDSLSQQVPISLSEVLDIPGIGLKTASRLHRELGVTDLTSLEAALVDGRIRSTKGMGARLEQTVATGLEALRRRTGRASIGLALPLGRAIVSHLSDILAGARVSLAGSVRRMEETVADIDVVVGCADPAAAITVASGSPLLARAVRTENALRVDLDAGIPADIFFVPLAEFGTALVRATGNAAHLTLLGDDLPKADEERSVYERLGQPWIPPELRQGEAEFRRSSEIPGLVTIELIRGEYHCHSTWSDGTASVAEMAAAAARRGYRMLAITDHSQSLGVANGLTPERIAHQRREIDAANGTDGVRLLQGSEVEVSRDGHLDYDDALLASLDIVVASTHSGLRQPRETLTNRLLGVLRNPNVDIIAHPSGRLIERRDPGDFDWDAVFATAAETGTALEINADPARLDLNPVHAAAALAAGCLLTINCDAHGPDGFGSMEYGIAVARRAWATPECVINCWEPQRLLDWLAARGR